MFRFTRLHINESRLPMTRKWSVALLLIAAQVASSQTQPIEKAKPVTSLHAGVSTLPFDLQGPFVQLSDGKLLCVNGSDVMIGDEDGSSWTTSPLFGEQSHKVRPEQALLRMRDGTIVCVFLDDLDKRWRWSDATHSIDGEAHLYVWSIRSSDGGKTWTDLQRIQDGYSGAIRDLIETDDGRIIVPVQKFLPDKSRHVTIPYVSTDGGKTWTPKTVLDIDGHGHHDGALEATVVERRDHSLWMLLRSNHGVLYESVSADAGETWSTPSPTKIEASSSPALIKRLTSGRLILIWNQLRPTSGEPAPRRGGEFSRESASWHRSELSIAFSSDDGKSWSEPVVIASQPGDTWLAYPYLLEPSPGLLWITTMQGDLRLSLNETDFVGTAK